MDNEKCFVQQWKHCAWNGARIKRLNKRGTRFNQIL